MPISGKKGGVIVERTFNRSFLSIYIVRTAPFCNESMLLAFDESDNTSLNSPAGKEP